MESERATGWHTETKGLGAQPAHKDPFGLGGAKLPLTGRLFELNISEVN